jgi:hypothetical protein
VKHLKQRKKDLPVGFKTHDLNKKRGEKALEDGEDWAVSNYYSPDAVEADDDDDDENYGQEQDMTPHGGRTPSGYSSAKSNRSVQKPEECKKVESPSRQKGFE